MAVYISFLRGINVGKSKRISKETLGALFSSAGFENPRVFIQSGNVIFDSSPGSVRSIAAKISAMFKRDLDFDVPVVVMKSAELASLLKRNPFAKQVRKDPSKVLIGFFDSKPDKSRVSAVNKLKSLPNLFEVVGEAIYLYCPEGVGRAKLPKFEKELGVAITFRNARVCEEVLKLARADSGD